MDVWCINTDVLFCFWNVWSPFERWKKDSKRLIDTRLVQFSTRTKPTKWELSWSQALKKRQRFWAQLKWPLMVSLPCLCSSLECWRLSLITTCHSPLYENWIFTHSTKPTELIGEVKIKLPDLTLQKTTDHINLLWSIVDDLLWRWCCSGERTICWNFLCELVDTKKDFEHDVLMTNLVRNNLLLIILHASKMCNQFMS